MSDAFCLMRSVAAGVSFNNLWLARKKAPLFYGLCLTRSLNYVKLPENTVNYLVV